MRTRDAIRTAGTSLRHARVRSILTMLGVVIGIASVILLMSIGTSAERLILNEVQSVGSNLIFVIPGGTPKGSRFSSPASAQGIVVKTLVRADTDALLRDPAIDLVAPEARGQAKIVFENNDLTATFIGTTADYFAVRNVGTTRGAKFTERDVDSFNRVLLIGSTLSKNLFGERDPVGKTIRLKDIAFRVVGILESKGVGPGGVDQDNLVIIPISVAQKQLLGIDYYNFLTIQVNDEYAIDFAKSRAISIFRQNHRITNPDKDDFTIQTQEDVLSILGNITSIMTIFLTSIAAISLVVGGIGVMNIMLVSVVERTREVGLRKALGATNRDILQQFLLEAIMLTFIGGAIGILFGSLLTTLAYFILVKLLPSGWVFALPLSAIGLAVGVSTLTGLAFGIYPARQAARKNPIDALRYE